MITKSQKPPITNTARQTKRLIYLLWRWREPLAIFVGLRVGLAVLAVWAGFMLPSAPADTNAPYSLPPMNRWLERLVGVWTHWDGAWFIGVANNGYQPGEITAAYFPLYPLLVKMLGAMLGGRTLLAATILSNLATLVAFVLLYELIERDFGRAIASKSVLYLAVFPTAFFLIATYSEALFLALVLGAFLAARHFRRWTVAALLAALATLTRNAGVLLVIPLAWEWYAQRQPHWLAKLGQRLRYVKKYGKQLADLTTVTLKKPDFLAIVGLLVAVGVAGGGWLLFNAINLNDPLYFVKVQSEAPWNRHTTPPWETVVRSAQLFFAERGADGFLPPGAREDPNLVNFPFLVFFGLLFLLGCWQVWRGQMPLAYLLFFALSLLLPLFGPARKIPLISFPRYAMIVFPAYLVLAQLAVKRPWLHHIYVYICLLLLGLFAARFVNWYWVA